MANRRESGYGSFGDPMGGEIPTSKGGTLIKDRSKKEHTLKSRAQLDTELTFDNAKPDTATILQRPDKNELRNSTIDLNDYTWLKSSINSKPVSIRRKVINRGILEKDSSINASTQTEVDANN